MAKKTPTPPAGFQASVTTEETLVRVGLSGAASTSDVRQLRQARAQTESSHLPILLADDGITYMDTVAYGALVQWALAVRNRNISWVLAGHAPGAGRAFQMAGLDPTEYIYPTEDAARAALDRGEAGQRCAVPRMNGLAIEGLRPK